MDSSFKKSLWYQFGAAIDMLENAMIMCPEHLWTESRFWYIAYHTLFYLDYYLTEDPDHFMPPSPFTLSEFDPSGAMPDRIYSKEELQDYLEKCREKGHRLLGGLTDEKAEQRWVNAYRDYSILEIILYNMRHVQHHAAQLYLLLRQGMNDAPKWVSQTSVRL